MTKATPLPTESIDQLAEQASGVNENVALPGVNENAEQFADDEGSVITFRNFEEEMKHPGVWESDQARRDHRKRIEASDSKKPLLMAIKGQIYDMSQSRTFYGPGGPYALFAEKDASIALAKMSFEDKDLTGDISGLSQFELEALQDGEYKFMSKYSKVGSIKSTAPATEGESTRRYRGDVGSDLQLERNIMIDQVSEFRVHQTPPSWRVLTSEELRHQVQFISIIRTRKHNLNTAEKWVNCMAQAPPCM
ncbi:hypothetical protein ACFX2I_011337 [Malus domestica]